MLALCWKCVVFPSSPTPVRPARGCGGAGGGAEAGGGKPGVDRADGGEDKSQTG